MAPLRRGVDPSVERVMATTSGPRAFARQSGKDLPHRCCSDAADAVVRNAQGLYRYLAVRLDGDDSLAEDLMQELCLQAARSAPPQSANRQRVDGWVFGIARNVLRRHWRTAARRRRNLPMVNTDHAAQLAERLDKVPLPEELIERREVQQQVMLALTSLPAADQDILLRCYFDNQTQAQIAEALGTSPRAIEGRMYRARQALRQRLAHLDEHAPD